MPFFGTMGWTSSCESDNLAPALRELADFIEKIQPDVLEVKVEKDYIVGVYRLTVTYKEVERWRIE